MAPPKLTYNAEQTAFREALNVDKWGMLRLIKEAYISENNFCPNTACPDSQAWLERLRNRVILANFPSNGTLDEKVNHVRNLFPNAAAVQIGAIQELQREQQDAIEEHGARLNVQEDAITDLRERMRAMELRDAGGAAEPLLGAPVRGGTVPERFSHLQLLIDVTSDKKKNWNEVPFINDNEWSISMLTVGSLSTTVFVLQHPNELKYILKVVPFSEQYTDKVWRIDGLANEVRVSNALETLDETLNLKEHFVLIQHSAVVCGAKLPERLQEAWAEWARDHPDCRSPDAVFEREGIQPCYLLLYSLFVDGAPLDLAVAPVAPNATPLTMDQRWSIWAQLLLVLASAERCAEFEHRDLHFRNVYVVRDREEELEYRVGGQRFRMQSHGVLVKILDFGMARVKTSPSSFTYYNFNFDSRLFDKNIDEAPNPAEKECTTVYLWMGEEHRRNIRWDQPCHRVNLKWMYLLSRCILDPHAFDPVGNEWQWQIDNDPVLCVLKKLATWQRRSLHDFINLNSVINLNKYELI